jgi:DedD protein
MRFEIGMGGGVLTLLGLGILSAAVFALGLVAGFEIGSQQRESTSQFASFHPLPPPPKNEPATQASPGAGPEEEEAAGPEAGRAAPTTRGVASVAAAPSPGLSTSGRAAVARASARPTAAPPAAAKSPAPAGLAKAPLQTHPETSPAAGGGTRLAGAGSKPYNIQIEALMDRSEAEAMAQRLKGLGYEPHIVERQVAGQSWFRVQVGPYATQQEAEQAQVRLKQQYTTAYPPH